MIVVLIMSAALAVLTSSFIGATEASTFTQRKNEALDDLRIMTAVFAKDVRQGVEASVATPSTFTFDTYVDEALHEVSWQATAGGGDDRLERVVDGTVVSVYVVDLTTTDIFSYFDEIDPAGVTRVRIGLATQPDTRYAPVEVATEVEMRNVA